MIEKYKEDNSQHKHGNESVINKDQIISSID